MKILFEGDCIHLREGIEALSTQLGYERATEGDLVITAKREKGCLKITKRQNKIEIIFDKKIHFFRALGLAIEKSREEEFEIVEHPQFQTVGMMLDVSRGQVLKVKSIQNFLLYMAVMGLNMLMLYTEDIYEIEDEPYFGYMRGRYTREELRECDCFAEQFGIEIVPCIQTLGHMEQFLRWPAAHKYADTEKVLLADDGPTYAFIEKAILAATEPFRSKRIHIGMDEAHDIGLGKYLKKNGYHDRFDILNSHLQQVSEIAEKHGLKPMIWSDMYRHPSAAKGAAEGTVAQIAPDTEFVYWDYYREKEDYYIDVIQKHKRMGRVPIFAGGIWCWTGFGVDYEKTFRTTMPALNACKKEGVSEVFATLWGCSESSFPSTLMGLQYFAEYSYSSEFHMDNFKKRTEFCTGIPYEDFYQLTRLYKLPGQENQFDEPPNPANCLLWQDVLLGLYDADIVGLAVTEHYQACAEDFKKLSQGSALREIIFKLPALLCEVLAVKGELGIRLKNAYDTEDRKTLEHIANHEIPWLEEAIKGMRTEHSKIYFECNKPFGFDICDMRYGGLLMRLDTARKRINDYLEGRIEEIEELFQTRLPYDSTGEYGLKWRKYSEISIPHTAKFFV